MCLLYSSIFIVFLTTMIVYNIMAKVCSVIGVGKKVKL